MVQADGPIHVNLSVRETIATDDARHQKQRPTHQKQGRMLRTRTKEGQVFFVGLLLRVKAPSIQVEYLHYGLKYTSIDLLLANLEPLGKRVRVQRDAAAYGLLDPCKRRISHTPWKQGLKKQNDAGSQIPQSHSLPPATARDFDVAWLGRPFLLGSASRVLVAPQTSRSNSQYYFNLLGP